MREGRIRLCALTKGHDPCVKLGLQQLLGVTSIGYFIGVGAQNWGTESHRNEGFKITFLETGSMAFSIESKNLERHPGHFTTTPVRDASPAIGEGFRSLGECVARWPSPQLESRMIALLNRLFLEVFVALMGTPNTTSTSAASSTPRGKSEQIRSARLQRSHWILDGSALREHQTPTGSGSRLTDVEIEKSRAFAGRIDSNKALRRITGLIESRFE